jgi:hypothetical protein
MPVLVGLDAMQLDPTDPTCALIMNAPSCVVKASARAAALPVCARLTGDHCGAQPQDESVDDFVVNVFGVPSAAA